MRSSEHNHLIGLNCFFETFVSVRSHVDACVDCLTCWERNRNRQVKLIILNVVNTMHQSFIKVKNNGFLMPTSWEIYTPNGYLGARWLTHIFHVLQTLQCLNQVISVHILLCFCLIYLGNLSYHILNPGLRHQLIEKRRHLIIFLAQLLCFMQHFFRLFRKPPFDQFLTAYKMLVNILIIVTVAVINRIIEKPSPITVAASSPSEARPQGLCATHGVMAK